MHSIRHDIVNHNEYRMHSVYRTPDRLHTPHASCSLVAHRSFLVTCRRSDPFLSRECHPAHDQVHPRRGTISRGSERGAGRISAGDRCGGSQPNAPSQPFAFGDVDVDGDETSRSGVSLSLTQSRRHPRAGRISSLSGWVRRATAVLHDPPSSRWAPPARCLFLPCLWSSASPGRAPLSPHPRPPLR
jgi:hypothetical protein